MKVKSESEVTQSYPTLSDPMDRSLPGSSIHGIFQARVLEWGAIAFSNFLSYNLFFLQIDFLFIFFKCKTVLSKILLYFLGLVILRIFKQMPSIYFCRSHSLASTSIYLSLNPYRSFGASPFSHPPQNTHTHTHTHTHTREGLYLQVYCHFGV